MSTYDGYEFCVTWKIENFSLCYSPESAHFFVPDVLNKNKYNLIFQPFGFYEDRDVTACSICYNGDGEVCIDYRIEMIDPSGRVFKSAEGKNKIFKPHAYPGILCEATKEELGMESYSEDVHTIRCHIRNRDRKVQVASASCEFRTKILVEQHSFELKVFKSRFFKMKDIFKFEGGEKMAVDISKPESSALDDLTLNIKMIGQRELMMRCEATVVDDDDNSISKSFTHHFFSRRGSEVWELSPFITRYDCANDRLLQFKFLVSNGSYTKNISTIKSFDSKSTTQPKTNFQKSVVLTTLQKDLRDLFMNKKHTDVTLKAGNTTFPAHKLILKARSPVFEAMFDQDMIENQSGVVDVKDVDEKCLNSFLEYLYTETVNEMDYDRAKNLLLVSDKYQVLSLREKCSSQLVDTLAIENVCEVCTIADMIADDELKKSAFDFMTSHAVEVMQRPEWSQWSKSNSLLSIEILSKIVLNLKKSSK